MDCKNLVFVKNCSLLQKKFPDLYAHLLFSDSWRRSIKMPSKKNSEDKLLPDSEIQTLYCYGFERNYGFFLWKNWLKSFGQKLVCIVDDLDEFACFLHQKNSFFLLEDQRVFFLNCFNRDLLIQEVVPVCAEKIAVLSDKRLRKKQKFFRMKKDILEKNFFVHARMSDIFQAPQLWKNFKTSMKRSPRSWDVGKWKNSFHQVPAIICGAGPSIDGHITRLKDCLNRSLVMAGGSAIAALSAQGIVPHLAVAVDPTSSEYSHLKKWAPYSMPLIYSSRLHRRVFSLFSGSLGYMHSNTMWEQSLCQHLHRNFSVIKDDNPQSVSVTTRMLSLAHFLGCNPIILLGVDLGYVHKRHYAHGVPGTLIEKDLVEHPLFSLCNNGQKIATTFAWQLEANALNLFAQQHSSVKIYTASYEGMQMSHIPYLPFEQWKGKKIGPIEEKIKRQIADTPVQVTDSAIEHYFYTVRSSIKTILSLMQISGVEENDDCVEDGMIQALLEKELAYRLFLKPLVSLVKDMRGSSSYGIIIKKYLQQCLKADAPSLKKNHELLV
ncbi:MAG: motility associated factor glycosyltransferase family protein [Parachlamydiales bacterium]|nr:motility associated factor glycosyltransferase family protein [Parachlamydiales bacterium]